MERRGRKTIAEVEGKKALYCLKAMEGVLNKFKAEVMMREHTGAYMCIEVFKEHYGDVLKTTDNDNEQSG